MDGERQAEAAPAQDTPEPEPGIDPQSIPNRVSVSAGGHHIEIESGDPLEVVLAAVRSLWDKTETPNLARALGSGAIGFGAERAGGPQEMTYPGLEPHGGVYRHVAPKGTVYVQH